MADTKTRRDAGDARPYQRKSDGMWCVAIELPPVPGKKRNRKVITRADKAAVIEARAEFMARNANAGGNLPSRGVTVAEWFTYWLKHNDVRPNTLKGYRSVVRNHIIPELGKIKLDDLTADDIRRMEQTMRLKEGRGSAPSKITGTYVNQAHTVMSIALRAAQAERKLNGVNVASAMKAPKKTTKPKEVLDLPESLHVIESLRDNRLASLWSTYFLTGARRGEVIGLERDRTFVPTRSGVPILDLSWQLQRLTWSHGCGDPVGVTDRKDIFRCGAKRGNECPERYLEVPGDYEYRNITGGLYWTRPKSSKGWRIIPLVDPLASILEYQLATEPENAHGLVWTQPSGWPLDPDQTTRDWSKVLDAAGIDKNVTIHDIRHSTADLLFDLDIDLETIQDILGQSVRAVTRGYRTRANMGKLSDAMGQLSELFPVALRELPAAGL